MDDVVAGTSCVCSGADSPRTDYYAIPFLDQYLLYRPLRSLAFVGNRALADYIQRRLTDPAVAQQRSIERFLDHVGFWRPGLSPAAPQDARSIRPTQAVLLLTTRCNLRCVYCYADAGGGRSAEEFGWPTARIVLDAAFANAEALGKTPSVTFHGGGEPTLNWDILVRSIEYGRSRDPNCRVSMSSNGVWSDRQREYIVAHFDSVSLSMDGAPDVQDVQRPFPDGSGSSGVLRDSLAALDQAELPYGIRMTVLPQSASRLAEGVEWVCRHTRAATVQVEPTFTTARGVYGDLDAEFADAFSDAFMDAWRIGVEAGRSVYYSGARPWVISHAFCLAPFEAMVARADGGLVTCFEVFHGGGPEATAYTVGRVKDGHVEHDYAAMQRFLADQEQRRQACRGCFCYWHCCGDCATRRRASAPMTSGRCRVTRTVTRELLAAYVAEGNGLWQGLREQDEHRGE